MSDTVDELLRQRAAEWPDKPAVIEPESRITYGALDSETLELAAAFVAKGVGKGDRIGLIMPNGVDWVRFALALMRIGAVLVPLSTLLQPRELVAQLRVAGVQALVTVDEFRGHRYVDGLRAELGAPSLGTDPDASYLPALPALRHVWSPTEVVAGGTGASEGRADDLAGALTGSVRSSDPMVVLFTSGSSGMPKGTIHSHGSALGAVRSGLTARCIDSDTRLYLPMPFFWVGGFGGGVLSALVAGATLVTEPVPEPATTLQLLERERVTLFRGWPDQAETLARHAASAGVELSSLRQGSLEALLPIGMRAAPGARAKLFGMTESFGPYCGYPADTDMPASAWGSCGKPFAGMEVRVVDVDSGAPCGPGEPGELQLRGPHTLRGICRRSREQTFTVDGFYPTGDLGHLDADGFLFYHGRTDDMFKVKGATVYPSEVERALRTLPGVRGAYVTSVPGRNPDDGIGSGLEVGAVVVCDVDTTLADRLRAEARRALSSFKVPTRWVLVDSDESVPRGATGKVDVRGLRDMLLTTTTEREAR